MALTQMELNLLREMICNAVASSNKLGLYAQQATEPQLKSFFQNASQRRPEGSESDGLSFLRR